MGKIEGMDQKLARPVPKVHADEFITTGVPAGTTVNVPEVEATVTCVPFQPLATTPVAAATVPAFKVTEPAKPMLPLIGVAWEVCAKATIIVVATAKALHLVFI